MRAVTVEVSARRFCGPLGKGVHSQRRLSEPHLARQLVEVISLEVRDASVLKQPAHRGHGVPEVGNRASCQGSVCLDAHAGFDPGCEGVLPV